MASDAKWAVMMTQAPAKPGFLAALVGGGARRAELAKALQSRTACRASEAASMMDRLPAEVGRYATEQEAKVAVQTLQDAGAFCEVRQL